jgi:oxaloacetate decarboxylase alpha subunit
MENDERATLNFDEIRELVRIASEADITELEVETGHLRVAIRKGTAAAAPAAAQPAAVTVENPTPAPAALASSPPDTVPAHWVPVIAPMVGMLYRAPAPDAPPFVNLGDWVEEGRTVCIIEAMKMFNEIPADVSGRLVRVLVENGTPVEYGQPLFLIDPRG